MFSMICLHNNLNFLSFSQAERLKLKPPRFKSTGVDDTAFLARVPQTTFYKVLVNDLCLVYAVILILLHRLLDWSMSLRLRES